MDYLAALVAAAFEAKDIDPVTCSLTSSEVARCLDYNGFEIEDDLDRLVERGLARRQPSLTEGGDGRYWPTRQGVFECLRR